MSGPANKRIKVAALEVTLDGQAMEIPAPLRNSLVAVYSHLESIALRRNALLASLTVDGVAIRLEKPMVPLRLFRRVEAVTARFDDFSVHLVPSLQRKLQHLHNRTGEGAPDYQALLVNGNAELDLILLDMEKVIAAQDPLMMSDLLEQDLCPWLREVEQAVNWMK
jgi:hypothetical protein